MSKPKLLVTGASGVLGRLVLDRLLENNAGPIVATTRNPERLADYAKRGVEVRKADFDDAGTLAPAFAGVQRALLISTDGLGRRKEQHLRAIEAFEAAGVQHVVYTSLPKAFESSISIAPEHAATEEALAATKLGFTILRNNFYMHYLIDAAKAAVASGKLYDARGDGAVAYVTREDCALAAAGALIEGAGRTTLDVTGPAALTSPDVAALLTEITGKKVEHVKVGPEDVKAALVGHGLPGPVADLLVSFDLGISKGDLAAVSDTVQRFSGQAPKSVKQFLVENRGLLPV